MRCALCCFAAYFVIVRKNRAALRALNCAHAPIFGLKYVMEKLIRKIKQWWARQDHDWSDPLIEGWYADQYQDPAVQARIRAEYLARHTPERSPYTHPLDYDPLSPPPGWRYDPYYECWVKQ